MAEAPAVVFSLPDGELELAGGELDEWAEHLVWCYRLLGIEPGATIGVVEFGASPVAFLGSRLLTGGLERGVAERLPARVICLDASLPRVALVPSVLAQVSLDAIVVRDEAKPLLLSVCRDAGADLEGVLRVETVRFDARSWVEAEAASPWRRLLVVERTMLIAPECPACGAFHLPRARYDVDPGRREARVRGGGRVQPLPPRATLRDGGCDEGPGDWLLSARPAEAGR